MVLTVDFVKRNFEFGEYANDTVLLVHISGHFHILGDIVHLLFLIEAHGDDAALALAGYNVPALKLPRTHRCLGEHKRRIDTALIGGATVG